MTRTEIHSIFPSYMPHYVSLMRWTSEGVAGLPAWRERVEDGERVIEASGGKLIGVYVTLGRYDVVEIFEAPDDERAVEILMKLQRYGAEHTETLRAFTREEAEAIIRRL
ncbi:MAG: GYD domain-containing protein [Actinobacteria bacterium]|nr:GYD domain-containing protein [Actinomycetota bacterium]